MLELDLSKYTPDQLRAIRDAINDTLQDGKTLNLHEELIREYQETRDMLDDVRAQFLTEPQKVAALQNACTTLLSKLVKLQSELYNIERVKLIEQTLTDTLAKFPDIAEVFLEAYEEALARKDQGA